MSRLTLNDSTIRAAFRSYLNARAPHPIRILDELRIQDGRNIADMVAIYRYSHCFEIKGETDDLRRLLTQSEAYNAVFPRISIITTPKHLRTCMSNTPKHWGVLLADNRTGQITFSYMRKAHANAAQTKVETLLLLWRAELVDVYRSIYSKSPSGRLTREDIALSISENISNTTLNAAIATILSKRVRGDRGSHKSHDS